MPKYTVRCLETIALHATVEVPEGSSAEDAIKKAQDSENWEENSLGTDDFEVYDEDNAELLYPLEDQVKP